MGLSAPRKRARLSHDPNNTEWSRSTTKYGQKILESHGWQSGDLLGAKGAKHAAYHTAANASHIRIALKDDTLGLGARHEATQEEGRSTGLDTFQDILGRLNGKSTIELEKSKRSRSDAKRSAFVDQRWGRLRFVSGGLLVGDKTEKPLVEKDSVEQTEESLSDTSRTVATSILEECSEIASVTTKQKKHEKTKDSRKRVATAESRHKILACQGVYPQDSRPDLDLDPQKSEEAQRKADKTERKRKRRAKKDAKQVMRDLESSHPHTSRRPDTTKVQLSNAEEDLCMKAALKNQESKKPPQGFANNRHAVRSRHIQHKKMAFMNSKALNEILMIKA
ncbi:Pin2-interacting protein X1, partial [Lecanoromycetidae sp. Uapishka_2]